MDAMNQAQGGLIGMGEGPRRDKNWDELDDAERVERMREVVKRLQRQVEAQAVVIGRLEEHTHAGDGSLLIPLRNRHGLCEGSYRRGEEWF